MDRMRQAKCIVALAVVAALLVAVPAVGFAGATDDVTRSLDEHTNETTENVTTNETDENVTENETDTNETANETAPGEQLAGIVSVGEAELQGDIDKRTYGLQVAGAATESARADVVAERLGDIEQRLNSLEERKSELDRQRDANSISQGKYNAEIARVSAELETAKQLANQSSAYSEQIPAEILEERNVSVENITALSERANNLSGQEVAKIARGIAGDKVGDTPADDEPVEIPDRPDRPSDERPDDGEQTPDSDGETTDTDQDGTADEDDQTDTGQQAEQ